MGLIREAEWSECKCCKRRDKIIQEEMYGCDSCGKEIDLSKPDTDYLRASVFKTKVSAAEHLTYCSWRCAIKGLKKVKSDYFVSLPYLHYDPHKPGMRAKDFFALVKP